MRPASAVAPCINGMAGVRARPLALRPALNQPKSLDHHRGRPGRDNVPSALGILAALRPLRFIRLSFAFSKMKRV
jgi:hypothetical protein